tara:strand:+ start:1029 stop:1658 length:630 start_codon:yes stop_codon:yes gene_type:complete
MKIPKGMTEKEVLEVINKTVSYLAPSFKFGYFDIEDMKQEGTIFCIEALSSFNFDKSCQDDVSNALLTFLKTHVRWRFLNMRRKQLSRVEPPNCECNLCKSDSPNRLDCKKYANWVKRNVAKKSLMEPFDVDSVMSKDFSSSQDVDSAVFSSDIIKILNQYISVNIRSDYRKFLDGVSIPKQKRERLFLEIKKILKEHYSIKEEDYEDG